MPNSHGFFRLLDGRPLQRGHVHALAELVNQKSAARKKIHTSRATRSPKNCSQQCSAQSAWTSRAQPSKIFFPQQRRLCVEGAIQKVNGKWSDSRMFPGREFDDLDEFRAAKKQRTDQRAAYRDQKHGWRWK